MPDANGEIAIPMKLMLIRSALVYEVSAVRIRALDRHAEKVNRDDRRNISMGTVGALVIQQHGHSGHRVERERVIEYPERLIRPFCAASRGFLPPFRVAMWTIADLLVQFSYTFTQKA